MQHKCNLVSLFPKLLREEKISCPSWLLFLFFHSAPLRFFYSRPAEGADESQLEETREKNPRNKQKQPIRQNQMEPPRLKKEREKKRRGEERRKDKAKWRKGKVISSLTSVAIVTELCGRVNQLKSSIRVCFERQLLRQELYLHASEFNGIMIKSILSGSSEAITS